MDTDVRPAAHNAAAAATSDGGSPGYMTGFGNEFATEAVPGALPIGRNSPQNCPYDLYAEQISGTAFTAPRASNRRSWVYRLVPAAVHEPFRRIDNGRLAPPDEAPTSPDQMRWDPLPIPDAPTDFIEGLVTMAGQGDPAAMAGCAIHLYVANRSMTDRYFYDADGELLIVPQQGRLHLHTEMGLLEVGPQEICVIPRGIRFQVRLPDEGNGNTSQQGVRGYICENFGAPLRLPDLGVIGANGLANPRDFLTPVAAFEEREGDFQLVCKFLGNLWSAGIDHSPLDVVAWHGNHAPYKYDLRNYNAIGSVSFDHTDPSLLLVLHSPSDTPGIDSLDFLVFPPRYMAARDTFRPPWFHRNVASEFMGLIQGVYDSKAEGFFPGGVSLHNCMTGHGPDAETFTKGIAADTTQPHYIEGSIAFMFETRLPIRPTQFAMTCAQRQPDYNACWADLKKRFRRPL